MTFNYNDGGRAKAGYKGEAFDCVTRAISIASGLSYQEVYDYLHEKAKLYNKKLYNKPHPKMVKEYRAMKSPSNGCQPKIYEPYISSLGGKWVPTMAIGSGCRIHLKAGELPNGIIIARVTKHIVAVIDGVIQDTHDCSRGGTRCVYGYWQFDKQYADYDPHMSESGHYPGLPFHP